LQLGLDRIEEIFTPNLLAEEIQDSTVLESDKAEAKQIFEEQYLNPVLDFKSSEDVKKAVIDAKSVYVNYVKEEKKSIKQSIDADIQNIKFSYLSVIKFLEDLSAHIAYVYESNDQKRLKTVLNKNDFQLGFTAVFQEVRKVDEYVSFVNKHKFEWQDDDSLIKNFYRETLLEDEKYKEYLSLEQNLENDASLFTSMSKKILWKNAQVLEFFEQKDPFWSENFEIITEMLTKSFKKIKRGEAFEIINFSPNWELDYDYLINLYNKSVNFSEDLTERLKSKLKGWDIERISLVDRNIMEVAITEMVECPSIPTKVTINEFLDITKDYSSPKSKVFINGILDVLSKELVADKIIRKSGRGLMDNK
jgi:N utilization substance protein B